MRIQLDSTTEYILETLESAGFSAYAVGGSLRDLLLGSKTHDTDIATSARPEQVKGLFTEHLVLETGLKHGTVTLLINHIPYEITTFRTEGAYSDNRRPDYVNFTASIEDDLNRRDFTVNALAYNKKSGLIDLFGGLDDLKNKVLRAVGEPRMRFSEDALRIMRGLRFASVLGFDIEKDTKAAMLECAPLLGGIAVERIYSELTRAMDGDGINAVLREFFQLFSLVLPGAAPPDINITPLKGTPARLAALFDDRALAAAALRHLKADNHTTKKVTLLLGGDKVPDDKTEIKRLLSRYGAEALELAHFREHMRGERGAYERVREVFYSGECFSLSRLAVDGKDISALGFKGSKVGYVLQKLLSRVILGETENDKETLLNEAKNIDNP